MSHVIRIIPHKKKIYIHFTMFQVRLEHTKKRNERNIK